MMIYAKDDAGFNRTVCRRDQENLWFPYTPDNSLWFLCKGDFRPDSDVDIMILVDISDLELKAYAQQLSYMTYDFNMDHDTDIKPIAKSEAHFNKWIVNYPFYSNIHKEGVVLYGAA